MKKPIKICKNPDCKDEIRDYKSSKKEYCNDYCRNHHGHIRRSAENLEFDLNRKGAIKIYKLLKLYRDSGINEQDLAIFEKLGLDTKYLPEPSFFKVNGIQTKCYVLKDLVFGLDPKTETKIIIYKSKK